MELRFNEVFNDSISLYAMVLGAWLYTLNLTNPFLAVISSLTALVGVIKWTTRT